MSRIDETLPFHPVRIAVLTVSDTRTPETDRSGDTLVERLEAAGHVLAARGIVPDDRGRIVDRLRGWIADPQVDVILTTGGTGLTGRDVTVAVIQDVSGSMYGTLDICKAETQALLQQLGCAVKYYVADTEVKSTAWLGDAKKLSLELGGGTDLVPAIRKAVKDNPKPAIVIVFTDGYTDHPQKYELRGCKLIYVLCGHGVATDIPKWIKTLEVPT